MLKKSLILALALSVLPAVAFAQAGDRQAGDRACRSDATRLCRKVLEMGDGAVLQCLVSNAGRLSRGCRKILQDNGQL